MLLTEDEVLALTKLPQLAVVKTNKKLQDDHKVHIQGVGFEAALRQIIGYESVEQFKQKKLLTKPFTKTLYKKILNAQSRWKTAIGTSKFYNFKSDSEKKSKTFKEEILSQVWKDKNIETFIDEFLSEAIYEEFNGFFLIERGQIVSEGGAKYEIRNGIKRAISADPKPYICFKSVSEVWNFRVTGTRVEYIIFDFGTIKRGQATIQLYRVLDDKYDYIIEKDGESFTVSTEYPIIEHKAGQCPVVPVSTINKVLTSDDTRTSPIDDVLELLDYHLHQFAEHLVTEILHAHPNFYQVGQRCTEYYEGAQCSEGRVSGISNKDNKEFNIACPSCQGTGHNLKKDASTVLIIPAKDDQGAAFNITNVAGYIAPPIDALDYQQKAIDWMEEKILECATGLNNFAQTEGLNKTATGVMANMKPLEDIISSIITVIETVEKSITNLLGKIAYGDAYLSAEIIYGRKLALRDENTLLQEITDSKAAGASESHIKALNEELTYSRFIRSNYDLQRNIILNDLEPLPGYTFSEVQSSTFVSAKVKILKQNFNDFISRYETENGSINEVPGDIKTKVDSIKKVLDTYVAEVQTEMKAVADAQAAALQKQTMPIK